ncbi:MAG: sugar ABC transporter permease [Lachnospiraceae bacterium]|nr:sugar ABC transporter permease [Lachnospiraceae bacterium]
MRKNRKKNGYQGLLFLLPSLLGVGIFVLTPYLDVVRRSFTSAIGQNFTGLENYRKIFENTAFQLACSNTLRFVAVCIPLLLLLSLLLALLLQRLGKKGQWFKQCFLFPMAIPVASVVLLWRILFDRHGMVNALLNDVGFAGRDWMNSSSAFGVLVFSYIWKNLGYDIVLMLAGLSSISTDIYEAARVDGAGEWRIFHSITLPNLLPSLYTITVLSLLNSFKVFREAYLVAGNYPDDSMYLLQHLFNNWFRELSMDKMAAGAVVMTLVIFLVVLILTKTWGKEGHGDGT